MEEHDPNGGAEVRRGRLVQTLASEGIRDQKVLEAIRRVPRHLFVPRHIEKHAYDNRALPIGEGQTISQPLVVALMTEALELRGDEKVLEVGTGSGYQAAVLSLLAAEVHTVERLETLRATAREHLDRFGCTNVTCHVGDGTCGLPAEAPFDAICVTAAAPGVPPPLKEQLKIGGRLAIPVGGTGGQVLRCATRTAEGLEHQDVATVIFVPLIGAHGWGE
jgi:protein-L-isoaspartate(D-aspartate) O-methyltransferase